MSDSSQDEEIRQEIARVTGGADGCSDVATLYLVSDDSTTTSTLEDSLCLTHISGAPSSASVAAAHLRDARPAGIGRVLIAQVNDWPSAVAGASYAGAADVQLLLTSSAALDPVIRDYLAVRLPRDIVLLGSPLQWPDASTFDQYLSDDPLFENARVIGGSTVSGTSAAIFEHLWLGLQPRGVTILDAQDASAPNAVTAAAVAADREAPIIYTEVGAISSAAAGFLATYSQDFVLASGSETSVPRATFDTLVASSGRELALQGEGVIHYEEPDAAFTERYRLIRRGVPTAPGNGCTFQGELTTSPGEGVTYVNELAFDPSTCRSLVAVGIQEDTVADALLTRRRLQSTPEISPIEVSSNDDSDTSLDRAVGLAESLAAGDTRYRVHTYTYVDDPIRAVPAIGQDLIDPTSEVYVDQEFTPDGTCTRPGTAIGHHGRWKLDATRWLEVEYHPDAQFRCEVVYMKAHAKFANTFFCGGPIIAGSDPTIVHHWPTYVEGHPDGSGYHSWNTTKSGGCSGLLGAKEEYGNEAIV